MALLPAGWAWAERSVCVDSMLKTGCPERWQEPNTALFWAVP